MASGGTCAPPLRLAAAETCWGRRGPLSFPRCFPPSPPTGPGTWRCCPAPQRGCPGGGVCLVPRPKHVQDQSGPSFGSWESKINILQSTPRVSFSGVGCLAPSWPPGEAGAPGAAAASQPAKRPRGHTRCPLHREGSGAVLPSGLGGKFLAPQAPLCSGTAVLESGVITLQMRTQCV